MSQDQDDTAELTTACDRCKRVSKAVRTGIGLEGFFDVASGYWSKFGRLGEIKICDECMFASKPYIAIYGKHL